MEVQKKSEQPIFEFVLYVNNHIICQRGFSIWKYNKKCLNSLELYDMVTICTNIIEENLKAQTMRYSWNNFNPYKPQETESIRRNTNENPQYFNFEVRIDGKPIVTRCFSANVYHQEVRYENNEKVFLPINIKENIPQITNTIKYYLTLDTNEYNLL